jgi:hypothetical protein
MPDSHLDTAAQRPATGLDPGARELILRVLGELAGATPVSVVEALFRDRFGGRRDYLAAVETVRGAGVRYVCEQAMSQAEINAELPLDLRRRVDPVEAAAYALLMNMPEADFRLAVEDALRDARRMDDASERITRILRSRGIPWAFTGTGGFEWVGDELVEKNVLRPALSALNDPRFAGGVRSEFETARSELRSDTPVSRKQAVYEAGCSVESAMKVVLDEHKVPYSSTATAQPLFGHLATAGVVPRYMEREMLGAATPRNKTAGHGAGAIPHEVATAEAEGVVAAAASAIAYLAKKLP